MIRPKLTSLLMALTALITLSLASSAWAQVEPVDPDYEFATGRTIGGDVLVAPGAFVVGATGEIYQGQWGFTIGAAGSGFTYSEEDGNYSYDERGSSFFVNARGRLYPVKDGSSFWLAGGIALGFTSVAWNENDNGSLYDGRTSGMFIAPNFGLGVKFLLGDRAYIDPQLMVGLSSGPGGVDLIGGIGAGVGMSF